MKKRSKKLLAVSLGALLLVSSGILISRLQKDTTNSRITPDMSPREMERLPQLTGMTQWFISTQNKTMKTIFPLVSLKTVQKLLKDWNADTMCEGVQRLVDLADAGVTLEHDIYNKEEKAAQPDKAQTKLFYMPAEEGAPFAVVCAGGAYNSVCSIVEAFPVGARLNQLGYNAFVLSYRVGGSGGLLPKPVDDLAAALRYIFAHAEEFAVSTEHYAVVGFSAGGHLAALWGTARNGCSQYDLPKPAALILGYPALDFGTFSKTGQPKEIQAFLDVMLGEGYTQAQADAADIVKNVTADYPPTYFWHCTEDNLVPFSGSASMEGKLAELKIPHQLRPVEQGGHGQGLGVGTKAEGWLDEAVAFWADQMN